jgi:acetyl/propionyl-CoA carboxylase alpha subunit
MFDKILIANRGEIAVRIMATCREMGIRTVAVYSEVDRDALHVLEADETVLLGLAEPSESYLNVDRIIEAAKTTGAQAIHPGYGFLAENASFAERCVNEKIVFIGPPAQAIRDLGDKDRCPAHHAAQRGCRSSPGMMQPEEDTKKLAKEAEKTATRFLIKAAGGGGGKGMRVVPTPKEFMTPAYQPPARPGAPSASRHLPGEVHR